MNATFTYLTVHNGLKLRLTADSITQTWPVREMEQKTLLYWEKSQLSAGLVCSKTPGSGWTIPASPLSVGKLDNQIIITLMKIVVI